MRFLTPFSRLSAAVYTGLVVLLGGSAAHAQTQTTIDLPYIGEPADNSLSPVQEQQLGARIVGQLYRGEYILEDAELSDYVATLGWRLAAASSTRPPELTFFVVNDTRINAFALPGGYIAFNAGLLLAADNESEVAGVMGHELAHVTQRHIARSAQDTEVANIATWLAVIAAIIAGSADPDVVFGALSIGQAMSYQRQVSYTRIHEQEADRIGIQTMAKAGFDPEGMASFFQKLSQQSRLYGAGMPEILRTHPLTTNRVAEARMRADELPKVDTPPSLDFALMRARTRVLSAPRISQTVGDFEANLKAGRDNAGNRYGLAFALTELGQSARALPLIQALSAEHPKQVNIQLLHARVELLNGHTDLALARYAHTLKLFPRHAPTLLAYADALLSANQADAARQLLLSHDQAFGIQPRTYNLLAQAAREIGNLPEAAYQLASYSAQRGDPGLALAQIDAGLRLPNLGDKQRARLLAKRQELRATLPDGWRPLDQRQIGLR